MSELFGSRRDQDRNIKDFTYKAEKGEHANYLPEEYKYPDDQKYTRKGEERGKIDMQKPAQVIEEKYDPESELASFLYLNITGQIETSNIITTDLVQLKYSFLAGSEWEMIEGVKSDQSQFAKKVPGSDIITWNLEFAAGYRSLSPEGWPQLILELTSPTRTENLMQHKGYSCVYIPTIPGTTVKTAKIFCPVKDSWWSLFKSKIFGPRCEIIEDPEQIASCEGREVTSIFYGGDIKIVFHVTQRNFQRFGYQTF